MIKIILVKVKKKIKFMLFSKKWRKNNYRNSTIAKNVFPLDKVSVGKYSYGPLNIISYGHPDEKLEIGNFCSIADDVIFLLGGEHHPEYLMNYPFKLFLFPNEDIDDRRSKGPIIIHDDVWIGRNSLILSGINIGRGAIIAAGSVVSKDVPPYAIYTTNRIIKYRFTKDIIQRLLEIDFSLLEDDYVRDHIELFYNNDIGQVLDDIDFSNYIKKKVVKS